MINLFEFKWFLFNFSNISTWFHYQRCFFCKVDFCHTGFLNELPTKNCVWDADDTEPVILGRTWGKDPAPKYDFPFISSEDTLNLFAAYRSEAENHRMLRVSSVLREIHTRPRLQTPDTRWWTSFLCVTEVFLKHIDIISTLHPGQLLTLTSTDSRGVHKSGVHNPKVSRPVPAPSLWSFFWNQFLWEVLGLFLFLDA